MYLIKDLLDGRIVYYWLNEVDHQISPHLSTLQHAEEWWKAYKFARYEGDERRASVIDRRSNTEKRRRMESSNRYTSINPYGRRATDIPVKVHRDLVPEKLVKLAEG
ncbi:hypothetical protein GCM10011352_26990 [Marinobacterium zhoushanense]|uniref:Uncharacterized protein n=1 Tax=Marinobacterium zhoushanense TaxID=1679163 RepID=A0ABQ1KMN3_9GAMM|nr:hypothetical protein [Marinobacterium zhoushanense]GGB99401.1 hypothetical protein GCM10011352_26990 [Marinobacterium zhoushanense]